MQLRADIITGVAATFDPDKYALHSWDVPGPGEGGGADSTAIELVPSRRC